MKALDAARRADFAEQVNKAILRAQRAERWALAPIDVRLILAILVLSGIIVAILATAIGIHWANSFIPPIVTDVQLETL